MKYHAEALKSEQFKVLHKVAPFCRDHGYYLAGGTALSIYFGHRISVDLDWFTSDSMGDALILAQQLREYGLEFLTDQTAPGTLHGSISEVRVTFLEFRYPFVAPPAEWAQAGCLLASLEDLACMKLSAIAQRGARKDFCDIYALGQQRFSLKEMLDFYCQKFGVQDVSPVLYGLAYFDDAESERMPEMLWDVEWIEMKKSIQGWLRDLGRTTAP